MTKAFFMWTAKTDNVYHSTTFFMLNSDEHEICPTHVKMQKIVGILTFTGRLNEPRCVKTGLRGFRRGPTQTGLYSHRGWLEA